MKTKTGCEHFTNADKLTVKVLAKMTNSFVILARMLIINTGKENVKHAVWKGLPITWWNHRLNKSPGFAITFHMFALTNESEDMQRVNRWCHRTIAPCAYRGLWVTNVRKLTNVCEVKEETWWGGCPGWCNRSWESLAAATPLCTLHCRTCSHHITR